MEYYKNESLKPIGDNFAQAITDREFALFQALVHRVAGIFLSPVKKSLLVGRLAKRLRELKLSSFGAYYQYVTDKNNSDEMVLMLDCICTNETHFFREPRHFELLETQIFPQWQAAVRAGQRNRQIRVWSAACSTGEEPYSLAMMLRYYFPIAEGWKIEILATDLSTKVLKQAQAGLWPIDKAGEIPNRYLKLFMLKGAGNQQGNMKVAPSLGKMIRFQRLNLNDRNYAVDGPFDLIFCRNVMIYFNAELKIHIVDQLLDRLDPQGYLFIGHSESLNGITNRVKTVIPTVFVPKEY